MIRIICPGKIKEEYLKDVELFIEISNKMVEELYKDFDNLKLKVTKMETLCFNHNILL